MASFLSYRFFDVNITRLNQGLTTSTNLSYRGENLIISSVDELENASDNHVVLVTTNNNFEAYITFNNLGTYYIEYTPICPYTNFETLTNFYNGRLSQRTSVNAYVFGYQLYFTSSSSLNEFKKTNTDVPYIIDMKVPAGMSCRVSA